MKSMTAAEIVRMSVLHPRFIRERRDAQIRALRMNGKTLQEIADAVGLTRARVQQVCAASARPSYSGKGRAP